MGIELPSLSDVAEAIARWRTEDPRLETLLQRYTAPARALRHYGLILWEQGDPQTAAQMFTGAVAMAPEDARLWTDLSGALNAAGQLLQAAACMEESLLRDKMQPESWLRLGSIRSALDDSSAAETALRTALALDAGLTDARLSLGLICFHLKRFGEAAEHLAIVLQQAEATPAIRTCYGQALAHTGNFAAASEAFRQASESEPDNAAIGLKLAQARFITDVIDGPLEAALQRCRASAFVTTKQFETISRQAFHLLSAFGLREAAIRLGEARLAQTPDDAECAYLLAVLRGDTILRTPDRYVTSFFDQFADEFDKQLVDVLGYTAFQQLAALVDTHATALERICDLGCGTGLAGPLLARPGRHLVGVDLSSGMLDKARARGCYDALIQSEAVAYLEGRTGAFDLIFAADVLIYVGDLEPLMARVAEALGPGGLFAFTIESAPDEDLTLLPSGRFAHGLSHVLALADAASLSVLTTTTIQIRYETQGFVSGELILAERR